MEQQYNLTQINGAEVFDRHGVGLGTIRQLTVNVKEGYIEYATLRIDSGEKNNRLEVDIPWSQFRLAKDSRHLELNISLAVLEAVATRRSFRN
ncbi:MAG: PRC-barrel domain-containing protein [Lysobacterales bacterium]